MKAINFIGLLTILFQFSSYGQVEIPEQVTAVYHHSGRYRAFDQRGAFDNTDSTSIRFLDTIGQYHTSKIYQHRKVVLWDSEQGAFNKDNINQDSTITLLCNIKVSKEAMEELVYWTKKEHYAVSILQDTFSYNGNPFISIDTIMTPPDLHVDELDIDLENFEFHCSYFKSLIDEYSYSFEDLADCGAPFNSEQFIDLLIEGSNQELHVSSYVEYILIRLVWAEKELLLYQSYPEGLNTAWTIEQSEISDFTVINPFLNDLIYQLMPWQFSALQEFKDIKNIVHSYLYD